MKFVKLTCNYYRDPAVAADLSDAGEVAFTRGIAYCGDAETGGFIPEAILPSLMRRYTPARGRKIVAELVMSELWVVVPGGWQIRTWDRQQEELERLLSRRKTDAERQRRHRADKAATPAPLSRDIERDSSRDSHVTPFACAPSRESEVEEEKTKHLITLVCRRLSGDARATTTTDDERAELWAMWRDVAGPGVDLAAELRLWFMRNAETDLTNAPGALLGWLRKARQRATSTEPLGCHQCSGGWLPDDPETGHPVPCRACRPHLRGVAS